ncbi:hypothetical protein ABTI15_20135, partial [Acinetobacter baumannii]
LSRERHDRRLVAEGLRCCRDPMGFRNKIIIEEDDDVDAFWQCRQPPVPLRRQTGGANDNLDVWKARGISGIFQPRA